MMKRFILLLLAIALMAAAVAPMAASADSDGVYGLAAQKLATRNGPGTQYEEKGTYNVAGQYIKVLSRAWDERNGIWWVKCEIPYKGEIRVLWTGYKRFDSSTLPLESIPVEGESATQNQTGVDVNVGTAWAGAYRQFFTGGTYRQYIRSVSPEWADMVNGRDTQWDCASLYDMDANGVPELIVRSDYGIEQADVFTFSGGQVLWLGTMGGDNFFQDVFCYSGAYRTGLYIAQGGPAMRIRGYRLENGRILTTEVATTMVNADGDETIGVRMNVNDDTLYALLYGTFVGGPDTSRSLPWYRSGNLQNDSDWLALYAAVAGY